MKNGLKPIILIFIIIIYPFVISSVCAPHYEKEIFLSNLTFSDGVPNSGDIILVNVTITNNRNISLDDTYVEFWVNDILIENKTNITVGSYESKIVTFEWFFDENSDNTNYLEFVIKLDGIDQISKSIRGGNPPGDIQNNGNLNNIHDYTLFLILIIITSGILILRFRMKKND
jgi:hypothetical protein